MKKIVMILFAGLLVPAGLSAQEVYKDASNRVILDLTAAAGMPAGAITNTPKTWTGSPSNNSGPLTDNGHDGDINAMVFQKLETAPSDLGTMNWAAAFDGCRTLSYNGGGWRLPTQRELYLIWIFREALESIFENDLSPKGSAFLFANYWCATEANHSFAWEMSFYNIDTPISSDDIQKTNQIQARCVREVTN
jgi:hypothetical protein